MAKIRNGFVSNSSSSSFIIAKHQLSEFQIEKLYDAAAGTFGSCNDSWYIRENAGFIHGFTPMDNGQDEDGLEAWLKNNDYPLDAFKWEYN